MGTSAAPPDPQHLVITTPGRQYNSPEANATVVLLGVSDFLNKSVSQVRAYVENFGTLKTLTIVGHGNSLLISADHNGPDATADMGIPIFLDELKKLQKETGVRIADRIVFDACKTMTDLDASAVEYVRNSAKELGAEIVGATTSITYDAHPKDKRPIFDKYEIGLFVAFRPDGTIGRDSLSTTAANIIERHEAIVDDVVTKQRFNFFDRLTGVDKIVARKVKADIAADPSQNGDEELTALNKAEKMGAKWFACHDGKSQEEGAACQLGKVAQLPRPRVDSRDASALKTPEEPNTAAAKEKPTGAAAASYIPVL